MFVVTSGHMPGLLVLRMRVSLRFERNENELDQGDLEGQCVH